jgi:hypothetical protein
MSLSRLPKDTKSFIDRTDIYFEKLSVHYYLTIRVYDMTYTNIYKKK